MSINFKSTLTICSFITIVMIGLLALSLTTPAIAEVENIQVTETTIQIEQSIQVEPIPSDFQFGSYVYRAQKGDNLTYFARRSIQLYLESNNNSPYLETDQIIAAETHIVQDLGAFEVEVGQEVGIDVALVRHYVQQVTILDEVSRGRWAIYEPIRQSLDFIEPLSIPYSLNFDEATEEIQTNETDLTEGVLTEEIPIEETLTEETYKTTTAQSDSSLYLTMIGALIFMGIVVWILAWSFLRNTKDDEDIRWKKSTDKTKKLKKKVSDSKITKKIKTLPTDISQTKNRVKKLRSDKASKTKKKKGN